MPIIPALGKWRQGNNSKLEASLVYTATSCLSGFYGGRSSLNNNKKKKQLWFWNLESGGRRSSRSLQPCGEFKTSQHYVRPSQRQSQYHIGSQLGVQAEGVWPLVWLFSLNLYSERQPMLANVRALTETLGCTCSCKHTYLHAFTSLGWNTCGNTSMH